jgi:hypothetical protein
MANILKPFLGVRGHSRSPAGLKTGRFVCSAGKARPLAQNGSGGAVPMDEIQLVDMRRVPVFDSPFSRDHYPVGPGGTGEHQRGQRVVVAGMS